ncbi:hypothetical protein D3C80_1559400 [compost metagenome]
MVAPGWPVPLKVGVLSSVTSFALSTPCLSPCLSVTRKVGVALSTSLVLSMTLVLVSPSPPCASSAPIAPPPNAAPAIQPHGASLKLLACSRNGSMVEIGVACALNSTAAIPAASSVSAKVI